MRKLLFSSILYIVYNVGMCLPTMQIPLLMIDENIINDKSEINKDYVVNIKHNVQKISSQIRGAIIKINKFKVIDSSTVYDIANYHDVTNQENSDDNTTQLFALTNDNVESPLESSSSVNAMQNDIEYSLVGTLDSINCYSDTSAIKDTTNMSQQTTLDINASFKLLRLKDKAIVASFTVNAEANIVKIVPNESKVITNFQINKDKLLNTAINNLTDNLTQELMTQFNVFHSNDEKKQNIKTPAIATNVVVYH